MLLTDITTFAKVLICITILGGVLGLTGVWFPNLFKGDIGWKLIGTFVVISVTIAVATGIFQYLSKP